MKTVNVWTDGSCYLNERGRGGYGALIIHGDIKEELYGGYLYTTNNRAELIAVLVALSTLIEPCKVNIYSDSKYVIQPVDKKWIYNWVKKDFKGIKNSDLWKELLPYLEYHQITFEWCKSHAGNIGNIRADELADMGASLPNLQIDRRC